jgi:hypothetical protein
MFLDNRHRLIQFDEMFRGKIDGTRRAISETYQGRYHVAAGSSGTGSNSISTSQGYPRIQIRHGRLPPNSTLDGLSSAPSGRPRQRPRDLHRRPHDRRRGRRNRSRPRRGVTLAQAARDGPPWAPEWTRGAHSGGGRPLGREGTSSTTSSSTSSGRTGWWSLERDI